MMAPHVPRAWLASACEWTGRLLALALALFWLAFLVEHIAEWYLVLDQPWPPLRVSLAVAAHALIVLSLVLTTWRLRPGALLLALATFGFLTATGLWTAVWIPLLNSVPPLAIALGMLLAHDRRRPAFTAQPN